jgi:hypothetical protein
MYDPNDPTGGSHPPGGGCDSSTSSPDWSTEPTRLGGNDADINAKNSFNKTPLEVARERKQVDVIKLLLAAKESK